MRKPEGDIGQPCPEWPGDKDLSNAQRELIDSLLDKRSVSFYRQISLNLEQPPESVLNYAFRKVGKTHFHVDLKNLGERTQSRPPFNAEYILYLLLRKEERDVVIGDLIEDYGKILERFNKRRADIWFYKQVAGSLLPLLGRAILRLGALAWLGRMLRRLIS